MSIAVIGSGPAGLIAAQTLATAGERVTVYEQRRSAGRKFLLAGRSGLNLTHSEPLGDLLDRYGPDRPALEAAIRAFDSEALQHWCAALGEPVQVGSSGRVFPASFRATPLLRAWLAHLDELGVEFMFEHTWNGWSDAGQPLIDDVAMPADATVLAVGGASWPRVGGDGSWQSHLAAAGLAHEPMGPANCAVLVSWSDVLLAKHEGAPLKNVAVHVSGDVAPTVRGDLVITRTGIEGGPVYALSRSLATTPRLAIDLMPDLTVDAMQSRLEHRRDGATQTSWLRSAGLSAVAIAVLRDATGNQLPDAPAAMAELIKALRQPIDGLAPLDRAISSSGGLRFSEIDDNFMIRSIPGSFAAGEMLDWQAPTGGYLLQACFSTGVAAANGVLGWLDEAKRA